MTGRGRLSRNDKVPWRIVEGEAILLDLDEGEAVRLNAVGAEIWHAIDGTHTVEDIAIHIAETFEVSPRKAARHVRRFVKQLLHQDLVREVVDEPASR